MSINVLDRHTADLIAAGEVVERPASLIKELIENSADAGATSVVVEIKNGGTSYIRVTDNGCGMSKEDLEKCTLRHATSKIRDEKDLYSISTLGFRGEALAAICAVCDVKIFTKRKTDEQGYMISSHFGALSEVLPAGSPDGTTVVACDIFSKVPARRKFLKKDFSEAQAVLAVCEKFALSRPDISVSFISDSVQKLSTDGDGKLENAIFSCLGKDFAKGSIYLDYTENSVRIFGYIGKPELCRASRSMQNFFINSRFVKSRTMMAALEEGFRSFCPVGKFPAAVLFCDIDASSVDVNIHPAKTEVKFTNEKAVFDTVYFAVKNALERSSSFVLQKDIYIPQTEKPSLLASFEPEKINPAKDLQKEDVPFFEEDVQKDAKDIIKEVSKLYFGAGDDAYSQEKRSSVRVASVYEPINIPQGAASKLQTVNTPNETESQTELQQSFAETAKEENTYTKFRIIGEIFDSYIVVQKDACMYLIDKHAAHERIIYEGLKDKTKYALQQMLEPVIVSLSANEVAAISENEEYIRDLNMDIELFGSDAVAVRAIPYFLPRAAVSDLVVEMADRLVSSSGKLSLHSFDKALYTVACKAAVKAGQKNTQFKNEWIVKEIFENEAVLYCPHGRPVLLEFTRDKIDRMFKRT